MCLTGELTVKDSSPPGCAHASRQRREQQERRQAPCLVGPTLVSTRGGKEYLVKAVQVLAFEVFYYLVIKLSGFSEGAQPRTRPGNAGRNGVSPGGTHV